MNIEENRLNTFTNWPSTAEVGPVRIAKAGFYYTGQGLEVQCFSCGGKISEWNYGDQVMARHRRLDPNCQFVMDPQTSGNVALDLNESNAIPETSSPRASQNIGNFVVRADAFQYDLTEEDEMYKNDALRLLSFVNWPDNNVSRELLVNAGLYHMGDGRVRCAWCGGEHQRVLGPDPLVVHHQIHPHCRHAGDLLFAHQEPIVPSIPSSPLSESPPDDDEPLMTEGAAHNNRILSDNAWQSLGVIGAGSGGARNPANATLATRLATFVNWPEHLAQKPAELAEAGFYFSGEGDRVHCYYCDGGLGAWEVGDIPWNEHARWFPDCGYVTLIKGREFVESCKNSLPEPRNCTRNNGRRRRVIQRTRHCFANFYPISEEMITEQMESQAALDALDTGLDASRVRRAIIRRLQITGGGYRNSAALINAALDGQFDEEPWSEEQAPQRQSLASDLYNSLGDMAPSVTSTEQNSSDRPETSGNTDTPTTSTSTISIPTTSSAVPGTSELDSGTFVVTEDTQLITIPAATKTTTNVKKEEKKLTLEEENRKLREVTMCKVCMDREVSVVFLPCGHLVSCAECGASLGACPLCRSSVKALVRAYLA